jgi:exosortase family protein XrtF
MKDFKPALRFLLVFVGVYLVGNVVYGIYVESYKPGPDPATRWVTAQTAAILIWTSEDVTYAANESSPYVLLQKENVTVLQVFEGCNGINVFIVFISFVLAFGGSWRQSAMFLILGIVVIHAANLLRILLLYYTAIYRPLLFYYFHKYFFTAALYGVVFVLWIFWTRMKLNRRVVAEA